MWHFPEKFEQVMSIKVDGKRVPIHNEIEGLMFLNIDNYAGGAHPWGFGVDDVFQRPSYNDVKVEVCAATGSWHMSNVCVDVTPAIRFAQGKRIEISIRGKEQIPMQVDGEPMVVENCDLLFDLSHQVTMLRRVDSSQRSNFMDVLTKIC
jgi:hypothetical protein